MYIVVCLKLRELHRGAGLQKLICNQRGNNIDLEVDEGSHSALRYLIPMEFEQQNLS